MSDFKCAHCGRRIIRVNDSWTHQPAGSAFLDNTDQWCHLKVATPADPKGEGTPTAARATILGRPIQ